MHKSDCCGVFRGPISIREITDSPTGFICLGNSTLNVTQDVEVLSAPDYQSFGGAGCELPIVNSMGLTLALNCTDLENLKLAFGGEIVSESGTVEDEEHDYISGSCIIPFNTAPNPNETITVTDDDSGSPTTFVKGEDYNVVPGGIEIISGGAITPSTTLLISYSKAETKTLNINVLQGRRFEFFVSGTKYSPGSSKPVVLRLWKVGFNPVADFALIGDGLATLNLTATVYQDASGHPDSPWGVLQSAEAYGS